MARLVLPLLSLIVASCGGGGGGGSPTPTPVQVANRAPVIADPEALSVREGTTSVATIRASDPDNNSLTFTISSGDDQALFSIASSGALSFSVAPDFEAPGDVGSDNVYDLIVQVSDGTLTDTQSISITVSDAFEGRVVDAPISGASVFVDLNGNNEQEEGEPSGTTDANGFFNVDTFTPIAGTAAKVISKGGTDTKTGKALPDLALISDVPADLTKSANVTPLTTVVASVDTPEAKAAVLTAMGISVSPEDLLTNDGWAAAEAGDENAKANQRLNQQVGLLLQTAATVADDGNADTDVSVQLAKALATQISTAAVSDEGFDLTSSNTLNAVLVSVVAEVVPDAVIAVDAIAAIAASVAAVNTVVSDPNLDPLSDVALGIVQAAQEKLQEAVSDVVSGNILVSDFDTATDTTRLFEDVVVAVDALDTDGDGIPNVLDADDDADGVVDAIDAFPLDKSETLDTDGDGTGNNADTDDDADGVLDTADAFPLDKSETLDTDSDGVGNNTDTDDDGDSILDTADAFPLDKTETLDTDADGIGNNADTDDDADGVLDTADAFPLDKSETLDTDSDGVGNNTDTDDDGDSILDTADAFPLDKTETLDTDADGIGNNADTDDDNDGTADADDAEPLDAFPWDKTLSIAQPIDQKTFPVNFFDASGTNDIQGLYSESEVGVYFDISQAGIARSFGNATTIGASEQTGTWSFTNNQLKLSGMRFSENTQFPSVSINDSQYTNIDWDKWAASSNGAQLSLVAEIDRSYWVISSANGRYEVYEKTIAKYYAASDVDYAIDPEKPVQTLDPVYKKRLFASVDETPPLTWSEGELVDSAGITWALPLETKRQNGFDRKEGFEMISQDLATFSSDNTGQSRYGNRAFKWRIEQDGLTIEYQDKTVLRLYKYLEQPGFLGIRVLAFVQGDTGASEIYHAYKYGIKQEVDSLDMTQFFGRGLISEYSWSPVVPLSEKYSQALMLEFKDTGKVDARSGMPPSSGPRVWNLPYRTYSWKASGTKISADWCRNSAGNNEYADAPSGAEQDGVLDYCDYYLQSRLFEVLSIQERGAWISMNVRSFVPGGTYLADALAIESADTLASGNVYTAFWSFQDNVADMDADGVLNGSDSYPFISLDGLADLDKDGIPDDCDSACIAKGMIADDDDDGDGVVDSTDAFPRDASETADTDVDGIGNNADTDDDNDGVLDAADAFPLISLGGLTDQDGDGRPDECDVSCQTTGMYADLDDDGDGFVDTLESKLGAKMTDATSVLAYRVRGSAIEGASANARAGIVSLDGKGDRLAIGHGDEAIAAGIFDWDDASSAWVKIQDSSITIKGSVVSISGDGKTVVASPNISDIAPLMGLDIARSAVSDDGSESWALNSISSGYSMDGSTATFASTSDIRITPIDNVALSQTNRLVYGMPSATVNGRAGVGSIALFEIVGDDPSTVENEEEWKQSSEFTVGIDVGSGFGDHVAISSDGNTIAASGRFANDLSYIDGCPIVFLPKNGCPAPVTTTVSESFDPATRTGAVAVWRNFKGVYFNLGQVIKGALGSQLSYIDLSDDGSILSVASPKSDENGTDSGSIRVYSYDETGRVWMQLGNTINDVPVSVGEFGRHALSGDGQVLVVTNSGGYGGAGLEQAGSVDAYRLVNGIWTRIGKRLSGGQRQSYAWSVDLNEDGSVLAVGARYFDGVAGADTGRVQVYELFATTDSDRDGIPDSDDAFKDDPTEYLDTDSDGIGNNIDTDDDEDGTPDSTDAFPLDKSETTDTDSDGFGNLYDSDDDGDGVADTSDAFALISLGGLTDTDGDGRPNDCDATCQNTGMTADTDDDADGVVDTADGFPLISLGTLTDTDGDGRPNDCDATCQSTGMTADTDDDGDGTADSSDAYPLEACCWVEPAASATGATLKLLPQVTNTISGTIDPYVQDGRVVSVSLESTMPPSLGTVTMNASGGWTYQTNATSAGSDNITYYVSDGVKTSDMLTLTITLVTDPLYKYQWHLDNTGQTNFATTAGTSGKDINVDAAIVAGKTGAGVKVAVVDSGLELAHEDLAANVISGSRDFVNSDDDPTPSSSVGDHGTSVAGIIGAVGWNNIGVRGVAPGASLKGYNYLVPSAQTDANWISTFGGETYSADIDIFNLSAGRYRRSFSTVTTVELTTYGVTLPSLRSGKGALLVKSAGNSFSEDADYYVGSATCGYAAGFGLSCHDANLDPDHYFPTVIVVGALAADGRKSSYSSVGSPLWVSAPGGEYGWHTSYGGSKTGVELEPAIMTTDLASCSKGYVSASGGAKNNAFNDYDSPYAENSSCNYVSTFNGTSSAAPNVSGVVALMLEANPSLTWRDVKHILATTSTKVDASFSPVSLNGITYYNWVSNAAGNNFHPYYGFGGVDATAAVNAAVSYTAGSLGSQLYKTWTGSGALNATVNEGTDESFTINIATSGTVEFVRVAINMSHDLPAEMGLRLFSPSGTPTMILQPYTALNTNPNGYIYLAASAFYGESMDGNWTLKLFDHKTNSTQMVLGDWSIAFYHR